jgi:hypothetical protein
MTIFVTLNISETISLAIMLYTCETQPLVLGKEYILQCLKLKWMILLY